jgi:aspartyl protease family protein
MAYSSSSNSLVKLAVSWGIASVLGVAVLAHREELRAFMRDNGLTIDVGGPAAPALVATPHTAAASRAPSSGPGVRIRATASGHFETRAEVNGRSIDVMVDTGATVVALTWDDARAVGVYVTQADFKQQVNTANGVARVAPVTLDWVAIEGITVRNVRAVVAEPGNLSVTLLGMSFLSKLGRAEMSRGELILQE